MEFARVSRAFDVGAGSLWERLRRFGAVDAWLEGVSACVLEGEGEEVGAIRLVTRNGKQVRERLCALDEAARRLSYEVLPPHGLPARNVRATLQTTAADEGRSRVAWWAEADLEADAGESLRGYIEPFYAASLANLDCLIRNERR